jgi:hypothetical protein
MSPNPTPMTLGNMRANGVRTLAAWCLGRGFAASRERAMVDFKAARERKP